MTTQDTITAPSSDLTKSYEFTKAQIAELEALRAENALLKEVEVSVTELHGVALVQIEDLTRRISETEKIIVRHAIQMLHQIGMTGAEADIAYMNLEM